jgi:hypothetical protein
VLEEAGEIAGGLREIELYFPAFELRLETRHRVVERAARIMDRRMVERDVVGVGLGEDRR